jgi:hypothetical protein
MSSSGFNSGAAQVSAADEQTKVQAALDKKAADWSNLPETHNLNKFQHALKAILDTVGYDEMYGVQLVPPTEEWVELRHFTAD